MQKEYSKSFFFGVLILVLSACGSTKELTELTTPFLNCKMDLTLSTAEGEKKIPAVIQLIRGSEMKVSLRAPMLRSELGILEYSMNDVVLVDRTNRIFASGKYMEVKQKYRELVSFETIQSILESAASNRQKRKLSGASLGWDVFGVKSLKLTSFTTSPFELRPFVPSSRYEEVDVDFFIRVLKMQLADQ